MKNAPDEEDDTEEGSKKLSPLQDREENILEISQRLGRSLRDSFSVIFNPEHKEHDIHDSYRYLHRSPAKVVYQSQGWLVQFMGLGLRAVPRLREFRLQGRNSIAFKLARKLARKLAQDAKLKKTYV